MITRFLENSDETEAFGALVATVVESGDVVLLEGELGAGKTTFTKGFVAALGATTAATSPTFTLCHLYDTVPPVAHVDCWRLEDLDEVVDLALDEVLDEGGCLVIEWGERAAPLFGSDCLVVHLGYADTGRTAQITATGDVARRRLADLERHIGDPHVVEPSAGGATGQQS